MPTGTTYFRCQLRLLSESTFPEQRIPRSMLYREPTVPGPAFTAKGGEGKIALGTRLSLPFSLSLDARSSHPNNILVSTEVTLSTH